MEKKLYDLKIDDEFARLIPPLAKDELEWLEDSIIKDGCTDPLTVWSGIIIDGHNRYSICTRLGVTFAYEERNDFKDRDAVKAWIIERQLARRNLSTYQRGELGKQYEALCKSKAKKRQGTRNDLANLCQNSDTSSPKKKQRADDEVGRIVGISRDTLSRVKRIDAVADDEMKKKLESGEMSVNKAYTELFGKDTPDTVEADGKNGLHVEGKMKDEPDSFSVVKGLLEEVARNYLVSLEHILLQYTAGMVTEENNREITSMFKGTGQEANNIVRKRLEEIAE